MNGQWHDRIESDPQILRGKPCVKGTRIPAALVLGYLAAGKTTDEIIHEFPDLTPADVAACLDYARDLAAGRLLLRHDGRCHPAVRERAGSASGASSIRRHEPAPWQRI